MNLIMNLIESIECECKDGEVNSCQGCVDAEDFLTMYNKNNSMLKMLIKKSESSAEENKTLLGVKESFQERHNSHIDSLDKYWHFLHACPCEFKRKPGRCESIWKAERVNES
jgi:hypothetical protein|tara:strand:+ start:4799 stop:5134 length:336 start_codon:yes stop_codon:yes gene_type:complete